MSETRSVVRNGRPRCIAYDDEGRICGREAFFLDEQRGGMVCELHRPGNWMPSERRMMREGAEACARIDRQWQDEQDRAADGDPEWLLNVFRSSEMETERNILYIIRKMRERLDRAEAWVRKREKKQPGPIAMLEDVLAFRDDVMQLVRTRDGIAREEQKLKQAASKSVEER